MKKLISILFLGVSFFTLSGCKGDEAINTFSKEYKVVNSNEDVISNMEEAVSELKALEVDGDVVYKNKQYQYKLKVIGKDTIENSIVHLNVNNIDVYLKDQKIYVSYMYKNTNVVVKDSVDNFVNEVCELLSNNEIKCNKDKINKIIKEKTIEDIKYEYALKANIKQLNNTYIGEYKGLKVILNDLFLVDTVEYISDKVMVNAQFSYKPVSIKIPLGYDLFPLKIDSLKELLRVDNLAQLIK